MDPIALVQDRIRGLADVGQTIRWGMEGQIRTDSGGFEAAACTRRGLFGSTTSAVLVKPAVCGTEDGLVLVLAEGNFKDSASVVAVGAVVAAFADELDQGLISDADVSPALRRAVFRAHDSVWALQASPVTPGRFGTVMGPRSDLRGIGASVVAAVSTPSRAWLVSVGECPAWLLRQGTASRLNHPHTLANDAAYRAAVRQEPAQAIEFADSVVMKVLGLMPEPPGFGVTRLDLSAGDRIILNNEWLSPHMAKLVTSACAGTVVELCEALTAAALREPAPVPVAVVVGGRR